MRELPRVKRGQMVSKLTGVNPQGGKKMSKMSAIKELIADMPCQGCGECLECESMQAMIEEMEDKFLRRTVDMVRMVAVKGVFVRSEVTGNV